MHPSSPKNVSLTFKKPLTKPLKIVNVCQSVFEFLTVENPGPAERIYGPIIPPTLTTVLIIHTSFRNVLPCIITVGTAWQFNSN